MFVNAREKDHQGDIGVPYLLKNTNMNWTVKKKENFINSSQNEGLSPSCISLSFNGFGSISWLSV
jgi:hypothetical protein